MINGDVLLSVRDLSVSYDGSRILRGVGLDVRQGEISAVMGRNGMGKTTLLKAIVGLLPADEGEITFEGEPITRLPADARIRKGIGYVPQGREIFPKLTVAENLEIGKEAMRPGANGMPKGFVEDLFPVLGDMKQRMGGNLSGGQQQQLAIARALVGHPKVLILDEPTEGIQPSIIQEIEKALVRLKEETSLTIILVEQYFDFARQIADHITLMDRGVVPLQGAAGELSDEHIKGHLTF